MATLKNLVDETTNIKNELKTCHANLRNNLISKGVECSTTDKMSSLINNIKLTGTTVQVSTEYMMNFTGFTGQLIEYKNNTMIIDKLIIPFNGSFKFCFSIQCRATYHDATAKIDLYTKDGLLKSTKSFMTTSTSSASSSKINCEYDISNLKESDYITITALSTHSTYGMYFNEMSFKGEVVQ